MNYEAMIKETDELVRRVMLHNVVSNWMVTIVALSLMVVCAYCVIREHRAKMREMKAQQEWEEMQIARNQQTYYRM